MAKTDDYVNKFFEYRQLSDEEQDAPSGVALADELDDLWYGFCPQEIDEIEPALKRGEYVDCVARYIELLDQLRVIPINDRPAELRQELDDLWESKFTELEKVRLDKALEVRG